MWQRNGFASNGVREFAEKGEAWTLMKEVEAASERIQSVYGVLSAPAVVGGTGRTNAEFEVFAKHSYVSLLTADYLRIENAEGYVLIAVYLFIYLYVCYSHNSKIIKPNRMTFGGMIGYYPGTVWLDFGIDRVKGQGQCHRKVQIFLNRMQFGGMIGYYRGPFD